jgi:hypothetical protein
MTTISVQSFTLHPRGGTDMLVKPLTRQNDPETLTSGDPVIPVSILVPQSEYDV